MIRQESFVPTTDFEEKMTASFLKKFKQCVDQNFSATTISVLQEYLTCVIAVAEIDDKYIKYFCQIDEDELSNLLIAMFSKFKNSPLIMQN